MIGSCKHSSLLWYGNNYCCKKFYSTGPWTLALVMWPRFNFFFQKFYNFFFKIEELCWTAQLRQEKGERKKCMEHILKEQHVSWIFIDCRGHHWKGILSSLFDCCQITTKTFGLTNRKGRKQSNDRKQMWTVSTIDQRDISLDFGF